MAVTEHAVTVVGSGPTGLMLASELALAGVDVGILERREGPDVESARGGGIYARTIEVLDQRGVAERLLAEGTAFSAGSFAEVPLDIGGLPTRHNYTLALWQNRIEHHLAEWAAELQVPIVRGCEVTGIGQHEDGIDVALADGATLRTQYLVGCDGARSVVRKAAGIAFPGWDAVGSWMVAELAMREEPLFGAHRDAKGVYAMGPVGDGRVRVVVRDERVTTGNPTLDEFRSALVGLYGTDFGVHDPTWLSRFSDAARQATTYRDRRVLLAGDAAHVHGPVGGQGLNLGVQDAVNLGWKLARVVAGTVPDSLLDTYHEERHPVGARVLQLTLAMTALQRVDDHMQSLIATLADPLGCDEPQARLAARLVGLDILRPRRRPSAARSKDARHRPPDRRRPDASLRAAPDGSPPSAAPRRAGEPPCRRLGRASPSRRSHHNERLEAASPRHGHHTHSGLDPPRRARGLGGRGHGRRAG